MTTTGSLAGTPALDRRSLRRGVSFWTVAGVLLVFIFASAAPSPLYVVYQAEWKFSAAVMTVVFAVYALALLAALVTTGALSDYVGRRPVLAAALVTEGVAMLVFATADNVGGLLVARVLQGLATGLAIGAISAGLLDLRPDRNPGLAALVNSATPGVGVATGALGSGLLVQYAPAPTTLVFLLLAGACAVGLVGVVAMPETAPGRAGPITSLLPRAHVPAGARGRFLAVVPILVACWSIVGLYMSLGPSVVADLLGTGNHLVGGLVIFALMTASVCGSILFRRFGARAGRITGALLIAVGLTISLTALGGGSLLFFLAGTMVAGFGQGIAILGAFATLSTLAEREHRAALFSTVYTVNYLAFSVPTVVAGLAMQSVALAVIADFYGVAVIVLALAGGLLTVRLPAR